MPYSNACGVGGQPRDIHVDGDELVDPGNNIVALFKRPSAISTSPHANDIFWLCHLVVDADYLRHHLFSDSAGHNHHVSLARRSSIERRPKSVLGRNAPGRPRSSRCAQQASPIVTGHNEYARPQL